MTISSNTLSAAVEQLLDRQETDVKSYEIRTELFKSSLEMYAKLKDLLGLSLAKNMTMAFIASADFFEQKWLRQRQGIVLNGAGSKRVKSMTERMNACRQKLKTAVLEIHVD